MGQGICTVDDCTKPHYSRGWCNTHYKRWTRTGDPLVASLSPRAAKTGCSIDGCTMPTKRTILGMCENHYARCRRNGAPGTALQIRVNGEPERRFWAQVDKDAPVPEWQPVLGPCWLWTGPPCGESRAYAQLRVEGVLTLVHRFSYELHVGPIPDGPRAGPPLSHDHVRQARSPRAGHSRREPATEERSAGGYRWR